MWLLYLLLACEPAPPAAAEHDLAGVSATVHTVSRGETVAKIAARYGVSVADLVEWNGINPDRIEVGQALILWVPRPASAGERRVAKAGRAGAPAVDAAPTRELPATVRSAGLLGLLGGESEGLDLASLSAGLQGRGSAPGGAGLGDRAHLSEASVDGRSRGTVRDVAPIGLPQVSGGWGAGPVSAAALSAPAPKRCLAGPTGSRLGDEGVAGTAGLSSAQAKTALTPMLRHVARCVPGGTMGQFTLQVELSVACDGRVSEAEVVEAAGAPAAVQACLERTLLATPFPAHDRAGGVVMRYPIRLGT